MCNTLNLSDIRAYGFDYDYTLATYRSSLNTLLFNLGRDALVERYHYPVEILQLQHIPNWAIRGLHYDRARGILLKLDIYLQIQMSAIYRGRTPMAAEEVLNDEQYARRTISQAYVLGDQMLQIADQFSVPEIELLAAVAEYFISAGLAYDPVILHRDTSQAVAESHPQMHAIVQANLPQYVHPNAELVTFLERLATAGKQLFLLTNSPFEFVDAGMRWLLNDCDWRRHFDVIIVRARKPRFFTDAGSGVRPLRLYDERWGGISWEPVRRVERCRIYAEGTLHQLQAMMGWRGDDVLYFGDHPYADLADVTLEHGWRTVAIVNELEHEIHTLNSAKHQRANNWQLILTQLIEAHQNEPDAATQLAKWTEERNRLRIECKRMFNEQFGSVFRTNSNPSYFCRRLMRLSDMYTSRLCNMMQYPVTHTFFSRRSRLPHE